VKITKEDWTKLMASMDVGDVTKHKAEESSDNGEAKQIVDVQLQRAVELLQGYDIFKTLEQNINVAKMNMETEKQAKSGAVDGESENVEPANNESANDLLPMEQELLLDNPNDLEQVPVEK